MKIEVNCTDGRYRHCEGVVEIYLPYRGLSDGDVILNFFGGGEDGELKSFEITPPNPAWVKQNEDLLSDEDIENIEEDEFFEIKASDFQMVCGACGSDQPYDAEE